MAVEIKVPQMGESITEVTIEKWLFSEGDAIEADKALAVLESDKATVELPAEAGGTLTKLLKKPGDTAQVGEVIAIIDQSAAPKTKAAKSTPAEPAKKVAEATSVSRPPEPLPSAVASRQQSAPAKAPTPPREPQRKVSEPEPPPSVVEQVPANMSNGDGSREEESVKMNRLRRTLARRLVEAQQNAALLTTFNEVDMGAVMDLRKQHGEAFLQRYTVKLGFMSFFVKAVIDALKIVPQVNAEIRGDEIIFKNYYDIAVAVGGGKGLVVPVLRNAERMSFAEVELAIGDFARRAKDNTLKPEELQGGTFTISNGGIYGSLLSTPIVNPPQSGILGMHSIQDRPVAREGQVVIRPMMYLALTYDHRLVDGREAVTFLKRVKEAIEDPARMLIEV